MTPTDLDRRLARVQLLLLDVDGVLTDGGVTYDDQGGESKTFHIRDGLALRAWQRAGLRAGIITGRSSRVVERRAAELGIKILRQGIDDKFAAATEVIAECGLSWDDTAFLGDDLPDLPVVARCGVGAAVVTALPGGRGAVRELIERLLGARGGWDAVVAGYTAQRA